MSESSGWDANAVGSRRSVFYEPRGPVNRNGADMPRPTCVSVRVHDGSDVSALYIPVCQNVRRRAL